MSRKKHTQPTSNPSPRLTRRRTINRPVGTFAHFLDALISYDFAYFSSPESGFTAYKEEIAKHLSIKPRHLSRLLSGQVMPEARLLRKLSERFPHIQTEGWIPRLTWACVERELELLPEGSTISLFVGHLSAAAIDSLDPTVAKNIALGIDRRKFKYIYFLAPFSARLKVDELSPTQFTDRLRLRILSGWLDANPEATRVTDAEKRIAQGLLVFETKASEEAGHFWSFLPRYLAASNLLADPRSVFAKHRFSVAFDSGSVPYSPARANRQEHVPDPVTTGGWSYMDEDYDRNFREMFKKMESAALFVNAERRAQKFPRPR